MYGEFQISLSYLARQTGPTNWEEYIYFLYMSYPSMQAKAFLILAPVQFVYFTIYLLHICSHIFIAFVCLCVLCSCLSSLSENDSQKLVLFSHSVGLELELRWSG